jgi:hypothetical protein
VDSLSKLTKPTTSHRDHRVHLPGAVGCSGGLCTDPFAELAFQLVQFFEENVVCRAKYGKMNSEFLDRSVLYLFSAPFMAGSP